MKAMKCDLCNEFEEGNPNEMVIAHRNYDICGECLDKFRALIDKIRGEENENTETNR